jgi:uncharacterized protein YjbI with pentapeptide repeats
MANSHHVKLLKQGAKVWNAWSKANPKIKPNFIGAGLDEADLRNAHLAGANFRGARLKGANLTNAFLAGVAQTDLASLIVTCDLAI